MKLFGKDCDIVFLSYEEPAAEENFCSLLSRFSRAKRIHGIKGMGRAYKMTCEIVDTPCYFIVDGDNILENDFDFDIEVVPDLSNFIKIWSCRNAVNGLIYGYGGVKLCSRSGMRTLTDNTLDVLGSGKNKLIFDRRVASATRFNMSPYDAWKAGFRECCMLQVGSGVDMKPEKAEAKIRVWLEKGKEAINGEWAIKGAHDGMGYALKNSKNFASLKKIDDPEWLKDKFFSMYKQGN